MVLKFSPCVIVRSRACKKAAKDLDKIREIALECYTMLNSGISAQAACIAGVKRIRMRTKISCEESLKPTSSMCGYRKVVLPAYRRGAVVAADSQGDFFAANTSRRTIGGPPNYFSAGVLHDFALGAVSVAGEDSFIRRNRIPGNILRTQDPTDIWKALNELQKGTTFPLAAIFIDCNRVPHIFTTNSPMIWAYVANGHIEAGFQEGECTCGKSFKKENDEKWENKT